MKKSFLLMTIVISSFISMTSCSNSHSGTGSDIVIDTIGLYPPSRDMSLVGSISRIYYVSEVKGLYDDVILDDFNDNLFYA